MRAFRALFKAIKEVLGKNAGVRFGLLFGLIAAAGLIAVNIAVPALLAPKPQQEVAPVEEEQPVEEEYPAKEYSGNDGIVNDILCARVWVSDSGEVVRIANGSAEVPDSESGLLGSMSDGDVEEKTKKIGFEIKNTQADQGSSYTGEDGTTYQTLTYSFVASIDGEPYPATLTRTTSEANEIWKLQAPYFGSGALTGTSESSNLMIADEPEGLDDAIHGQKAALLVELRNWCTKNAPTATVATWDGNEKVDHNAGTVEFGMRLNDSASTELQVKLDEARGSFTIGKN